MDRVRRNRVGTVAIGVTLLIAGLAVFLVHQNIGGLAAFGLGFVGLIVAVVSAYRLP